MIYLDLLRIVAIFAVITIHTSALNFYGGNFSSKEWRIITFYDAISRFAVPVYVMISGALFLNPERVISVKKLWLKNLVRIGAAFIIWSLIYLLYQKYRIADYRIISTNGVVQFVNGWYHMWFLFMIAGLYILTPLLRMIAKDSKMLRYALLVLIVFCFIWPTVRTVLNSCFSIIGYENGKKMVNAVNGRWSTVGFPSGFIVYFLLGYFLTQIEFTKTQLRLIYVASIVGFAVTYCGEIFIVGRLNQPYEWFFDNISLNVMAEAVGVFLFVKNIRLKVGPKTSNFISDLGKATFGIYLVHALYLEILRDFLHITPYSFKPLISEPVIVIGVFAASWITVIILRKIPHAGRFLI